MKPGLICLILLFMAAHTASAQKDSTRPKLICIWGEDCIGYGTPYPSAVGLSLNFNFREKILVTARGCLTTGNNFWNQQPEAGEISLLAGRSFRRGYTIFAFSAGVGRVYYSFWGPPPIHAVNERLYEASTLGVAFDAKILVSPAYGFGVCANAFGNLNPGRSYAGLLIGLAIGLFR